MTTLLNSLRGSLALRAFWDLRKGSLLDYSLNPVPNPLSFVNTPTWDRTRRGFGVRSPHAGSSYLTPGNPASLQLSTFSLFVVATRIDQTPANFSAIMSKLSALTLYHSTGAEPVLWGAWDWGGAAFRSSTQRTANNNTPNFFAVSFVSGAANGLAFYLNGNPGALATATIANQAGNWALGHTPFAGEGLGGGVLLAGIVNRVLTPAEHSALYDEWLQSGFVLDVQHRRGVKGFVQGMSDSEYARQGVIFSTDFKRQAGGLVRDLSPGGWSGTNVSCPVPGGDGESQVYDGVDDYTDFGNVTTMNSVAACSIELLFKSKVNANNSLVQKASSSQNRIGLELLDAANPSRLRAVLCNGAGTFGDTAALVRQGQWHHAMLRYNGGGATDADKLKLDLDGENVALAITGPIPATTGTMVASLLAACRNIGAGPTAFANVEARLLNVWNRTLSLGDSRAQYLRNFAQRCDWQAPGEDVPVSLAASYGVATPNALGGGWVITADTFACVEDAPSGVRRVKHIGVGHGAVSIPSSHASGTWYARWKTGSTSVQQVYFLFIADRAGPWSVGGMNGYMIYANAGTLYLFKLTAGASNNLGNVPASIVVDTEYEFVIARHPSTCQFLVYARGGMWPTWTRVLIPTDNAHVTSQYFTFGSDVRQDSMVINDPARPGACVRHWAGVLDPTRGEVP